MAVFFTSDLHFGSDAIISRAERPFSNAKEMGDALISNINERVKPDDTLYILGDVAIASYDATEELKKIACRKILIVGNHDAKWRHHHHFVSQFEKVLDIGTYRTDNAVITLCHYPMAEWDGMMKQPGWDDPNHPRNGNVTCEHWLFYGHTHNVTCTGAPRLLRYNPVAVNVGVDLNTFRPHTAEELMESRKEKFLQDYAGFSEVEKALCREYCPFVDILVKRWTK